MTGKQQKLQAYATATSAINRVRMAVQYAEEARGFRQPLTELESAMLTEATDLLRNWESRLQAQISEIAREMETW